MKFGIALPNSGPLASVSNIDRLAVEAEELGFDALLVHDHISYDTEWLGHRTSGLAQPHAEIEPDLYESLTTLAYAAAATRTIRLGTSILVLPLRDPRVAARQIITLQALSRGRLSLGVGSGDYPTEFRVMQTPYREKAAYTREHLEALRAILPGGRAGYRGKHVAFENGSFFPRVAPIPILMGGGIRANPRTGDQELFEPPIHTLARTCDGWIPEGPPELIGEGVALIARLRREYGRHEVDMEIRAQSPLYLGDDQTAMARLGRGNDFELAGSIDTVMGLLDRYREAGVDAMNLRCFADDETSYYSMIRTFAREIMPVFQ
ncbi:MAG: LLM class flavin-dependent oxidoreductase [Gammaproteobacteria bacterium]|nr:LLM class flavin-dependent oxidoreductase [Gammaproteobacteria bacterium]